MGWGTAMATLLLVLTPESLGLECYASQSGSEAPILDECRLNARGYHGRSTAIIYHPNKRPFEKEVCTKSLVRSEATEAWEEKLGCSKRSLEMDFAFSAGQCFYNTDELFYNWFVTCTCDWDLCNTQEWASDFMVPERQFASSTTANQAHSPPTTDQAPLTEDLDAREEESQGAAEPTEPTETESPETRLDSRETAAAEVVGETDESGETEAEPEAEQTTSLSSSLSISLSLLLLLPSLLLLLTSSTS